MSWYEIQGLFFGLLVSSMLKIAIKFGTLILDCSQLYIERILGFQKSPPSCHVTIQSWHNHFINPTWQQTKPFIVARYTNLRATLFPVTIPLSHVHQSCHELSSTWHDASLLGNFSTFSLISSLELLFLFQSDFTMNYKQLTL